MTTIWAKIVEHQLVEDAWKLYRGTCFPLQIRAIECNTFSSKWLEAEVHQILAKASASPASFEICIQTFKTQFFEKLNEAIKLKFMKAKKRREAHSEIDALDLQSKIHELEIRFNNNASEFFKLIRQALEAEERLLDKFPEQTSTPELNFMSDQPQSSPLSAVVSSTVQPVFNVDNEISNLRTYRDQLVQETNSFRAMHNEIHSPQDSSFAEGQYWLLAQKVTVNDTAKTFAEKAQQTFQTLDEQLYQVSHLLKLWSVDQRHVLNGAEHTVSLEFINALTTTVAKGFLNLYQILKVYNGQGVLEDVTIQWLNDLKSSIQGRSKQMMKETFIIPEQPKQFLLLKSKVGKQTTGNKQKNLGDENKLETGMTVRLLVGPTFKCLEKPAVEVSLISRLDARKVYNDQDKTPTFVPKLAMILPDNVRVMELDEKNNTFIANFVKIEMPKTRKSPARGPSNKTEEVDKDPVPRKKYYFHFRTRYSCPDLDIFNWDIFATSVPVIASTHTKTKDDSFAAILWDNASAEMGRSPFEVKSEIKCSDLGNIFSNLFKRDTGRALSPRNKLFLENKLMSCTTNALGTGGTVIWDMFFSNPLKIPCLRPESSPQNDSPDNDYEPETEAKGKQAKPVTFHSWFYETKQMCTPTSRNKTGIPRFWKAGRIEGFISKEDLTTALSQKKGRFALYFSEALLGGLTVAWCNLDMPVPLQRLSPFTPATFVESNELERRLHDQPQLEILYQEQCVDEFKKDAFPFPDNDYERMTQIQKQMSRRNYIPTFQETRKMNTSPILMHPPYPITSGGMRPFFHSVTTI